MWGCFPLLQLNVVFVLTPADDCIISTMALSPKLYQFLVSIFASLGSLLFGYDLGVIAQVIASQSFKTKFNPSNNEE